MITRLPIAIMLCLLACADAPPNAADASAVAHDSAGVRIVRNRTGTAPRWNVSRDPMVSIGGAEERGGQALFRVSSATRFTSGHIAVADAGASEVYVYDPQGVYKATLGRRGEGPGEFSPFGMIALLPSHDASVRVEQRGRRRKIATFDRSGGLIDEQIAARADMRGGAWYEHSTSSGGVAFGIAELEMQDAESATVTRRTARLMRFTMDSTHLDTIATYPGSTYFYADVGPSPTFGGGSVAGARSIEPLFSPRAIAAGGGKPFSVAAGDQAVARIHVFDESGTLRLRISWEAGARTPTEADVLSARTAYKARRGARDPAGAERSLQAMPEPSTIPIFNTIRVDRLGMIWVQRYPLPTEAESEWWVFDLAGVLTATISIPSDLWILEIGDDYVLGVAQDELDIQRVELLSLRRDSGT